MEVVWLASYPKSGNTWVRFLFTNLIHGPFETSGTIFDVTPVLERGIKTTLLRDDRINAIKTHHMFSPELPLQPQTKGVVYIVRDPFDVMMSNLNYFFISAGVKATDDVQQIANQYVSAYLQSGGDPRWMEQNYGSWAEHVDSWVNNSAGWPVLVLRYEDLLADTAGELGRACAFMELDVTDDDIAGAVERSSFTSMRTMEEREIREKIPGMFYSEAIRKYGDQGFRFMNKGLKGTARNAVSRDVIERFRANFMPQIGALGYA